MGQSAGGNPKGFAYQARQFQQMPKCGRIVTLREEANACLGEIGQLSWRCVSKILPVPHTARL